MYHPKIYPVWLCPFKLPSAPGMLRSPTGKQELFVDIGTYGVPKVSNFHPVETTRRVESFVRSVNGYVVELFKLLFTDLSNFLSCLQFSNALRRLLYDRSGISFYVRSLAIWSNAKEIWLWKGFSARIRKSLPCSSWLA